MNVWHILGIEPTSDERAVKRAYSRKLKETRPEDDPAAFQALRDAYEAAIAMLRHEELVLEAQDAAPAPVAAAEAQTTPDDAGPDPIEEAHRLWMDLFDFPLEEKPRYYLAQCMAREEMHDLRVREAFELYALRYCAEDDCPDRLREAIADHFGWESDSTYIERRQPEQAWETLARLRAWRSYQHFHAQASSDKAVHALLRKDPGRERFSTWNRSFTQRMQQLIEDIRMHHPELLHFKLEREVVDTWARRVDGRRYFPSTALVSLIVGWLTWALSAPFLARFDYPNADLVNFILIEALVLGVVAWYVTRKKNLPGRQNPLLQTILHDIRYRPAWQFGWLPAYVLASTALYVPDPPAILVVLIAAAMIGCVIMATFANSPVFHALTYFASLAGGIGLGQSLIEDRFAGQELAAILGAVIAIQVLYRGGSDLFDWSGMPPRMLLPMRLAWMTGAAGIIVLAATVALPVPAFLAASWLWLLAGMLLSRPSFNPVIVMFGALVLRILLDRALPDTPLLGEKPMPLLTLGFIVVAMFMSVNIFRANKHQHSFA